MVALPPRYAESELIAHGGMADVYRATDAVLDRVVAIKVLAERFARNDEFHERFLREARTAASLSGERFVVAIHDVGETDQELPYIVMEYAPGGTVGERLQDGPIATEQALRWLDEAASALDAAHSREIVHRDVKPANLLLSADDRIRVSDFGIARAAGHDTLTAVGTILGSAGYMAPEQARGEPSTDATDRYALACVAFELLTGSRPFERDSMTAEAAAHTLEQPPPVRRFDESLPSELDAVFARGLAKDPGGRPSTCRELADDLRTALAHYWLAGLTSATPTDQTRIVHRSRSSRKGIVLLAALALIAAGGLAAWALAGPGGGSDSATVVLTETLPGETVVQTVTTEGRTIERTVTTEGDTVVVTQTIETEPPPDPTTAPEPTSPRPPPSPTPPPAPAPAPPAPSGESGRSLNDRGFALLQQGNVSGALPLLEQAVANLSGDSSITEAYAAYNLAWARFASGRCDGVADLLDRSESIQGSRSEISRLRSQIENRCDDD